MSYRSVCIFLLIIASVSISQAEDSLINTIIKALLPKTFKFSEEWKNRFIGDKNFTIDMTLNGRKKREANVVKISVFEPHAAPKTPKKGNVIEEPKHSENSPDDEKTTLFALVPAEPTKSFDMTTMKPKTTFDWQKWMRGIFTRRTKHATNHTMEPSVGQNMTTPLVIWLNMTAPPLHIYSTPSTTMPTKNNTANQNIVTSTGKTVGTTTPLFNLKPKTTTKIQWFPSPSETTPWILNYTSSSTEMPKQKTTRRPWFKWTSKPMNVTTMPPPKPTKGSKMLPTTMMPKMTTMPTKPSSTKKSITTKRRPMVTTAGTTLAPTVKTSTTPTLSTSTKKSAATSMKTGLSKIILLFFTTFVISL